MTKKDYKLIALVIASLCPDCKKMATTALIKLLKADNPAFSEQKFIKAIG